MASLSVMTYIYKVTSDFIYMDIIRYKAYFEGFWNLKYIPFYCTLYDLSLSNFSGEKFCFARKIFFAQIWNVYMMSYWTVLFCFDLEHQYAKRCDWPSLGNHHDNNLIRQVCIEWRFANEIQDGGWQRSENRLFSRYLD